MLMLRPKRVQSSHLAQSFTGTLTATRHGTTSINTSRLLQSGTPVIDFGLSVARGLRSKTDRETTYLPVRNSLSTTVGAGIAVRCQSGFAKVNASNNAAGYDHRTLADVMGYAMVSLTDSIHTRGKTLILAVCLSLDSAIALGLTRFSYALLLPSMKVDLSWSFAQAGAINTANAVGYLIGALLFSLCTRHWRLSTSFIAGCTMTAVLMAASGMTAETHALLALRVATGLGSALVFIGGGVLAARLASSHLPDSGLVLGLYYGGAGWGIVVSALLVPAALSNLADHGWQSDWFALASACALCSVIAVRAAIVTGANESGRAASISAISLSTSPWHRYTAKWHAQQLSHGCHQLERYGSCGV